MLITPFQHNIGLIRQIVWLQLSFLLLLTVSRMVFFLAYSPGYDEHFSNDIIDAFLLGFRIDLTLVSYLSILPLLLVIISQVVKKRFAQTTLQGLLRAYFITVYLLVSGIIGMDFAFFSYFNEHINILFFGVFEDDTWALIEIARKNYNLFAITAGIALYVWLTVVYVRKVLSATLPIASRVKAVYQPPVYVALILLVFLGGRGSVGVFPLVKLIPDVSSDHFINALPKNGVFSFQKATKQFIRSKSGEYRLVKASGYEGKVDKAFEDFLQTDNIDREDLLKNLERTTKKESRLENRQPHVVVVMIESFGAPILAYQSSQFDILRRLKKHFDEDILFTNFISTQNGTIASLEPILLNVLRHPGGTTFGQGPELAISFDQAAARVYEKNGYETSFIYGGDLSWRNVGQFFSRQGFMHVEGRSDIHNAIPGTLDHVYGAYDRYAYAFVLEKLRKAKKPQFIFLLTTNNHPPYVLEPGYQSKPLTMPEELKAHLVGNEALFKQRIKDYQYAVDMAGGFMDEIKNSDLANRSVVAITADNNTMEGVMHYDDFLQESKQVPFYLYLPPYLRTDVPDVTLPGSQKDIFPTLYNRTLSGVTYRAIGSDLFDPNVLHCGFNTKGILLSSDGAFASGKETTPIQQECAKHYKAALAITETLVTLQK